MKTLELFNAVIAKPSKGMTFVSEEGYIIEKDALWAKDKIVAFYNAQKLSGNDLNKTFHKSWAKVKSSTRSELALQQIMHYLSTYGTNFQGDIYIPDEVLSVPDLKLTFKVIKAYSKEEMQEKCLNMLRSGVALKESTIYDLLSILSNDIGYEFTGKEGIKNKEAIVKIADLYGVLPDDTMEFFRYIIYRATGETLLIKNAQAIDAIKNSKFDPGLNFNKFGLERLAVIFNRFKPLFLAFKNKCPSVINKISKLSKTEHKPLVENPLNQVTYRKLKPKKERHWLDNATPFALFKALKACNDRMKGQTSFVYRIRNGKSWLKTAGSSKLDIVAKNYNTILSYIKSKYSLDGIKVYLPNNVDYALPTSEKMFVGNIPTGTRFFGKRIAAGIYWEDSWGARDLDLSGISASGSKVGWNARHLEGVLTYSGDITSAPHGAVEYLHADKGLTDTYLIMNNVFSGSDTCEYKIVIGEGSKVSRDFMMNPNKVLAEVKCQSVQKQTILGIFLPEKNVQSFVLLNFGAGHARVSGGDNSKAIEALISEWSNSISFNDLVFDLGAELVEKPEDADIDYSLNSLDKDSFTKIFEVKPALVV